MSNPLHARCPACNGVMSIERERSKDPEDTRSGNCFMCDSGYGPPVVLPGVRFEYALDRAGKPIAGTRRRVVETGATPVGLLDGREGREVAA